MKPSQSICDGRYYNQLNREEPIAISWEKAISICNLNRRKVNKLINAINIIRVLSFIFTIALNLRSGEYQCD